MLRHPGASAAAGVKSAGQLIMEQLMEATDKVKVLWNGDSYRTLLDASWAFAAASRDRVFASSVSGRLSTVGVVNGRATAENFLTADHVRELLQRTVLILEPVVYVPANVGDGVRCAGEGAAGSETHRDRWRMGTRNNDDRQDGVDLRGRGGCVQRCGGADDGATGKPKHDPETTVWLPVEKLDSLTLKLAVDRIMATLDGVVLQEMLGVFQGPQMLPNGTIVTASGLHTARGTPGVPGQEVAFIDVGEVAGMLEAMPLDRAKAVLKGYVDLFPYAEPEDGAVLVALTVTGFCRLAFKLAPLILIDAAIFGAGKTFAAERVASLNGTAPSLIACTNKSRDSGDEMRKRIETVLLTGQAGVQILDDVPGGELPNVESFRTVLTANEGKCSIRILGESRSVEVSPAKFTWIATGNNVRVSEDMVRRSVHARLDRDKAEVWGWAGEKAARVALDRIKDEPKGPRGDRLSHPVAAPARPPDRPDTAAGYPTSKAGQRCRARSRIWSWARTRWRRRRGLEQTTRRQSSTLRSRPPCWLSSGPKHRLAPRPRHTRPLAVSCWPTTSPSASRAPASWRPSWRRGRCRAHRGAAPPLRRQEPGGARPPAVGLAAATQRPPHRSGRRRGVIRGGLQEDARPKATQDARPLGREGAQGNRLAMVIARHARATCATGTAGHGALF